MRALLIVILHVVTMPVMRLIFVVWRDSVPVKGAFSTF